MGGHPLFDLSGKRGYVTGGGSGLGRAIALGLAEAGAVVVVSDINLPAAESVAEEIRAAGGRAAMALRTDVARKAEVEELMRVTSEECGGLDFAFNNAGMLKIVKPEDLSEQAVSGMIVNSGLTYSVAKAGVIQLTRVLALRWARHKVYVNCFSPGYIRTGMTAPHLTRPEVEQEMLKQTPLRRLGEPRDLVGAALFLASPASDFVTGHNLVIDGGVTLA